MINRDKLIAGSIVFLVIGGACGYLFSAKFCRITVVQRAEKTIALNQLLRKTLSEHSFWIRNYLHASFFNSPDKQAIETRLEKNVKDLVTIFSTYYNHGRQDALLLQLKENILLISKAAQLAKNRRPLTEVINQWKKNAERIASLISSLNNAEWPFSFIKTKLTDQILLIAQELEAMQENNWKKALDLFDINLEYILQFADIIDKGIRAEFPQKF